MKEITTKIYLLSELEEKAKEKAMDQLISVLDYGWSEDNRNTLDEFSALFGVDVYGWEYDTCHYHFNFDIKDSDIEGLEGKRLYSYIHNNFSNTVNDDCPLTGYHMDFVILEPVKKYLENPNMNYSYSDLIESCLNNFFEACRDDMEYYYSEENLLEISDTNEWYYFEDGTESNL